MSACFKIEFVVNDRPLGLVPFPRSAALTLETLTAVLLSLDEDLQGSKLSFSWKDENDYEALIESDADLKEAMQAQTSTGGPHTRTNTLRFLVTAGRKSSAKDQAAEKERKKSGSAEGETKPLAELGVEEAVAVLEKLLLPPACCALAREKTVSGAVLCYVQTVEDLREVGLSQDKLNKIHAKMLLDRLLDMRENGVPARFLRVTEDAAQCEHVPPPPKPASLSFP